MAVTNKTSEIVAFIKAPLEKAFSGSPGLLVAPSERDNFSKDFRWAFEEPGSKASKGLWQKQFDIMLDLMYDTQTKGLTGPLKTNAFQVLDEWMSSLQQETSGSNYDLVLGDPVFMQQQVLKVYAAGSNLAKDVDQLLSNMKNTRDLLQEGLQNVNSAVEDLNVSWVNFAKEISKETGSALERDNNRDWFKYLTVWSDVIDRCDNALPLCHRTIQRHTALKAQMEESLPMLLGELPTICFDLYGNMLAGATSEVSVDSASLRNFGEKLRTWLDGCPSWPNDDLRVRNKVGSGEVYFNRQDKIDHYGDNPSSVNVAKEEDIQVGISRFDFGNNPRQRGRPVATKLNVRDPHDAGRVWQGRPSGALYGTLEFYDSKLSWIEIPAKIREKVQFSTTTFDMEGLKDGLYWPRVFNPGMEEQRPPNFFPTGSSGEYQSTRWQVKFPRAFASDKINPDEITREGFRMSSATPAKSILWYGRVAYVAWEADSDIRGFHMEQYDLNVPDREKVQGQNHNFKPCFFPFPEGKFSRRPAVAKRMSMFWINAAFGMRIDMRHAVSKNGVVIQGLAWGDTIISRMKAEIICIANEDV